MKVFRLFSVVVLAAISLSVYSQLKDPFLNEYYFYKTYHSDRAKTYKDIEGSPYLNSEFVEGILYLKDTTAVKLPLRYNIYADEMEYQIDGKDYLVGNPEGINRIELEGSVFLYLPFIQKGGYFELFESGKCFLIQKRIITYKPAEGPKPIEATNVPAKFIPESNVFYLMVNNTDSYRVKNMKSVINALQDHKLEIENFIEQEKIRNTKKDNLIKIVKYYNSL